MSFKMAAILSVALVGGMFAISSATEHLALWYVAHRVETIPAWQRLFFGIGAFCASFRVLLALPTVALLSTVAILSNQTHRRS